MRFLLVLAITILALLAFGVGCAGEAEEALLTPTPVSESEGEAEEWEGVEWGAEEGAGEEGEGTADEGGEGIAEGGEGADAEPDAADEGIDFGPACDDFDMDDVCDDDDDDDDNDGFCDGGETHNGSDPLDSASVPETDSINPGSCTDGEDNDLDGDTDDADDGCLVAFEFHVVSANLGVTPRDYVGPCPVRVTFLGTITLEAGSGTVSYNFVQSDGAETSWSTLTFDSPGTEDVRLSMMMSSSFSGWMAIRVQEPEERESNRASFSVTCED